MTNHADPAHGGYPDATPAVTEADIARARGKLTAAIFAIEVDILRDVAELCRVLARLVPGCTVQHLHHGFGAPGNWGYGTPIGEALRDLYRSPKAAAKAE